MLLSPLTKPHHSFSPHQSQSAEVAFQTGHPFLLSSRCPILDLTAPELSWLRAGGRWMMGVVGKAERQR